jgi:hypothetical protein
MRVTEIFASTKSYPGWWADMEESRLLRRRRSSTQDTILERNLCFVDPPPANDSAETDSLANYIVDSFWRHDTHTDLTDAEKLNLLSGKGGSLVDLVLYIFYDGRYSPTFDLLKILTHF